MKIAGQDITTPFDDSSSYAPDWRHQIAQAVAGQTGPARLPPELKKDEDLKAYVAYLQKKRKPSSRPNGAAGRYRRLIAWYDGAPAKHFIEPLLLTEASYTTITQELGVEKEDVRLYERLFFNIRDQDGNLTASHLLKRRFAFGEALHSEPDADEHTVWRMVAITAGYRGLQAVWGTVSWAEHADPDDVIHALVTNELVRRLLLGNMRTSDLTRLSGNHVMRERMLHETGQRSNDSAAAWKLVTQLLQTAAPTVVKPDSAPETITKQQEALKAKLDAQQNIEGQPVTDQGMQAGMEALAAVVEGHFGKE
ncbi:MAG: hypothetical protein JXR37_06350 [Kiritimatiellae bacterium]|nr:hypothetical protein [Kiritimatiellia bacterium]